MKYRNGVCPVHLAARPEGRGPVKSSRGPGHARPGKLLPLCRIAAAARLKMDDALPLLPAPSARCQGVDLWDAEVARSALRAAGVRVPDKL